MTGMTLSDGFGAASNYTIDGSVEGDITRKVVNVSGSRADDGTTAIASSVFDTIETGTGQTLNLSGSATAAQSTPGIGITVNTATPGLTLLDGSGSASNYTLTGGTHTVDITATSAYITGSKVYDSFATVNSSVLSLVDPAIQVQVLQLQVQELPVQLMLLTGYNNIS